MIERIGNMKKVENLTKDERLKITSLARNNLKNYDLEIFSNNFKKAIDYSIKNPRKSICLGPIESC